MIYRYFLIIMKKIIPDNIIKDILSTYKNTCYGYKRISNYIKEVYNIDVSKSTIRNICIKYNVKKDKYAARRPPTKKEIELSKRIKELEDKLEMMKIELDSYKSVHEAD